MLRTVVASLLFALGVGSALAPTEASARSGGFAARAGVVRPALVRPGFVPPQPAAGPVVAPFQRVAPFRRHDRSPVTVWSAGNDQAPLPYLYPYPAVDGAPDQGGRIVYVPPPPGCRSESQMVPSEAGGERKVTITRCWH